MQHNIVYTTNVFNTYVNNFASCISNKINDIFINDLPIYY